MLTEEDLLIDIIGNAPINSIWNISEDSWEKIPDVFSEYICLNDSYGWDVKITNENRQHLIQIIAKEEIFDKVIHQDIKINGNTIFKSYDHMSGSYIKSVFPNFEELIKKYQDCTDDFSLTELE